MSMNVIKNVAPGTQCVCCGAPTGRSGPNQSGRRHRSWLPNFGMGVVPVLQKQVTNLCPFVVGER